MHIQPATHTAAAATAAAAKSNEAGAVTSAALRCLQSLRGGGHTETKLD